MTKEVHFEMTPIDASKAYDTSPAAEVCLKCGHRATIDGICQVGTGEPHPVTGYKAICGCSCAFPPAPEQMSWTEYDRALERPAPAPELHWPFAAKHDNCTECDREYEPPPAAEPASPPERIWLWPTSKEGCADRWHLIGHPAEGDIEYARVRPAQEQAPEEIAKQIVGTVFWKTAASHDTLERVMIERIADYLRSPFAAAPPPEQAREMAEKKAGLVVSQWMATPERHYADLIAAVRDAILSAGVAAPEQEDYAPCPDARCNDHLGAAPMPQCVTAVFYAEEADKAFRAGVAACVARLKTKAKEFKKLWEVDLSGDHNDKFAHAEVLIAMARELESLTGSAASPAAQEQEVNSGEEPNA